MQVCVDVIEVIAGIINCCFVMFSGNMKPIVSCHSLFVFYV